MTIGKRAAWILFKWMAYIVIVYYLWRVGFWHFVFVGLPWLVGYVGGLMMEYGVTLVLRYYANWWMIVFLLTAILTFLIFEFLWRLHRKDFIVGGEFEGRVVWAKGLRTGFIYDCWDLYNYIMWAFGKKKGEVWATRLLSSASDTLNGTAPTPWEIPIGPDRDDVYILYVKRTLLPAIPERWFIPRSVQMKETLYTFRFPITDIDRVPHPIIPGRFDYWMTESKPKDDRVNTTAMAPTNRRLLKRATTFVELGIGSDPETQKKDFYYGSFDLPQMRDEEDAHD